MQIQTSIIAAAFFVSSRSCGVAISRDLLWRCAAQVEFRGSGTHLGSYCAGQGSCRTSRGPMTAPMSWFFHSV